MENGYWIFSENVRKLRKSLGEPQEIFGERFGVTQATVSRWERGQVAEWHSIRALADMAGVGQREFIFGSGAVVPLVSWVAASRFVDTSDPYIAGDPDMPTVPAGGLPHEQFIALRVSGDSMNLIAPDGSLIFVDLREKDLLPGRYYVFRGEDEATFKCYKPDPPRLAPYSSNPRHEPLFPGGRIEVVGRVRRVSVEL